MPRAGWNCLLLLLVLGATETNAGARGAPPDAPSTTDAPPRTGLVQPPVAPARPETTTVNGTVLIDPYRWMRDLNRNSPETLDYVRAENAYTDTMTAHTRALQDTLFEELRGRTQQTDLDVPARYGDWYQYTRTEAGQSYPIYCRKKGSVDAPEEITLDVNALAAGKSAFSVIDVQYSCNGRFLAYAADTSGAERITIRFKDLQTGTLLDDRIYPARSFVWANDNRTLIYTRQADPAVESPFQCWRHLLGTTQDRDVLLHQEDDLTAWIWLGRTRSQAIIILQVVGNDFSEIRLLDADHPERPARLLVPREKGVRLEVDHSGDRLFIRTNEGGAVNSKMMEAPAADPSPANWKELIPHHPGVEITGFESFKDHLVVHEREGGVPQLRILDLVTGDHHRVVFPEPAYALWAGENPNFDAETYRLTYTSLVTPRTFCDYDIAKRKLVLLKRQEVLGGFDPGSLASERLLVRVRDGVEVPVSLVYRRDLFRKDGSNPLLLTAYGAYGMPTEPQFGLNRLSLLNRGFVYAIAHVRGGGELGEAWHEQGKALHKKNTFFDFIDCAEFLIQNRYTSRDKIAASGSSAGGMLMGVAANWRPDLFQVVVAESAALDCLDHALDPDLPFVDANNTEFGRPGDPAEFACLRSWDPYYNLQRQAYPNMLVTAGVHDPRVPYWEPLKWVARARSLWQGSSVLLLRTENKGHAGATSREQRYREIAFQYAFILDRMGMTGVRAVR